MSGAVRDSSDRTRTLTAGCEQERAGCSAEEAEVQQGLGGRIDPAARLGDRPGHLTEVGRRQAGAGLFEFVASPAPVAEAAEPVPEPGPGDRLRWRPARHPSSDATLREERRRGVTGGVAVCWTRAGGGAGEDESAVGIAVSNRLGRRQRASGLGKQRRAVRHGTVSACRCPRPIRRSTSASPRGRRAIDILPSDHRQPSRRPDLGTERICQGVTPRGQRPDGLGSPEDPGGPAPGLWPRRPPPTPRDPFTNHQPIDVTGSRTRLPCVPRAAQDPNGHSRTRLARRRVCGRQLACTRSVDARSTQVGWGRSERARVELRVEGPDVVEGHGRAPAEPVLPP